MQKKINNNISANKLILGALLGSVVVGTSAVLMSSKKKQTFTSKSSEAIGDLKDKLEEYLNYIGKKSQNISGDISDKASDYSSKIHDFALQISDQVEGLGTTENKDKMKAFLVGGILGGMLGAGASTWMSSGSGNKEEFLTTIGKSANNVKDTIQEILHIIDEKTSSENISKSSSSTVKDVIDFASMGLQIWQSMQSKK